MPIFNSRGEVLNDNDVDMLEQMLRGSLENHIAMNIADWRISSHRLKRNNLNPRT